MMMLTAIYIKVTGIYKETWGGEYLLPLWNIETFIIMLLHNIKDPSSMQTEG